MQHAHIKQLAPSLDLRSDPVHHGMAKIVRAEIMHAIKMYIAIHI